MSDETILAKKKNIQVIKNTMKIKNLRIIVMEE